MTRTGIETRIAWKLRGMLVNAVLSTVNQQCMYEQDVTRAQILYRTMVLVGPANSDDRRQVHDMLTQPKTIEVGKLHEHLVMWQFARNRLTKYGFQEPDASQLFETLKKVAQSSMEENTQFQFLVITFIMQHSSVNGLVDKTTVESSYDQTIQGVI